MCQNGISAAKSVATTKIQRWRKQNVLSILLVIMPFASAHYESFSTTSLNEMDFSNADNLHKEELYRELSQAEKRRIYQSDIRPAAQSDRRRRKRNGVSRTAKLWPNARIPYVISTHYSPHERALLAKAVKQKSRKFFRRRLPPYENISNYSQKESKSDKKIPSEIYYA